MRSSPSAGEVLLMGHLRAMNVHVRRWRLRQSIQRVAGAEACRHQAIFRRTYSVPGPNSLWHVDRNHKMIRWRLVVHGGIDSFSRLVTYLQCSNNIRSDTVGHCFLRATEEYGIPSRVRSDYGGVNVGIWRFMKDVCGPNRGSYIAGRSVHNTRIERLWRDVYTVSSTYINVFEDMEAQNILNSDNETDLFCLHYVFIPRINASLQTFRLAWNHHPLSTAGNRSPLQLYTGGSIGSDLFDENVDLENYGLDPEAPLPEEDEEESVVVPDTSILLSPASVRVLQATVNPLQPCNDHGIQLYKDTVHTLYQLMQNDLLL